MILDIKSGINFTKPNIKIVKNDLNHLFDQPCSIHCLWCPSIAHTQTQEREAKENMKRRAKELNMQRKEEQRSGRRVATTGYGSSSSSASQGGGGGMMQSLPADDGATSKSHM